MLRREHHTDKVSGSAVYDFYMGIELNPRFGPLWDWKLFHNGRPGIVAWTLMYVGYDDTQSSTAIACLFTSQNFQHDADILGHVLIMSEQ